ncbi:hypothetical protein KIH74_01790 [Kineosporia sp. J2-2]|uniref:Uncharacterized protein n=1 Tax=Kineosporia corallincola TaxID=2835133 RepID=A0ABS5T992_9ACTN|nr:hypothetical protein [Kineosporia corallincola]MBT0767637.1 hypothetical protein [Kineosporia corallincola]
MSSDLIGRRRIMQQRLDRVRDLELAMHEQVEIIATRAGKTVEQLDFDGSFRASLAALATLAARRPTFDVVLSLPGAPAGVRVQMLHDEVKVDVVDLESEPAAVVITSAAPPGSLANGRSGSMGSMAGSMAAPRAGTMSGPRPATVTQAAPVRSETLSAVSEQRSQNRPDLRPEVRPELRPDPRDEVRADSRPQIRAEVVDDDLEPSELVASDLAALLWEGLADPNDGRA